MCLCKGYRGFPFGEEFLHDDDLLNFYFQEISRILVNPMVTRVLTRLTPGLNLVNLFDGFQIIDPSFHLFIIKQREKIVVKTFGKSVGSKLFAVLVYGVLQ